jgi:hypothetical protein
MMETIKCIQCHGTAVIKKDRNNYCPKHYVQIESHNCLDSYLTGHPTKDDPILLEIKKQKPEMYKKRQKELEDFDTRY